MSLSILIPQREQRLIGPPPSGTPGEGGLLLDAVLEETIEHSVSVTSFPVELGADINDHAILEPQRYSMRGIVSDLPVYYWTTNYDHIDATTRSLSAYAILRDLQIKREPFDIDTGFLRYESMIIERFSATKSPAKDHAFDFTAQLVQLRVVENQVRELTTSERLALGQAEDSASPVVDLGRQAGDEVSSSLAADIVDAVFAGIEGLTQ